MDNQIENQVGDYRRLIVKINIVLLLKRRKRQNYCAGYRICKK
jgi:hypothetical protein